MPLLEPEERECYGRRKVLSLLTDYDLASLFARRAAAP